METKPGPKRSKFGSIKTIVDNITFDSKAEAGRYIELRAMQKAGLIYNLELQPAYKCIVNGKLICSYKADARYLDVATGKVIVEDTKGVLTAVYRIKRKLMLACHGIEIVEVYR